MPRQHPSYERFQAPARRPLRSLGHAVGMQNLQPLRLHRRSVTFDSDSRVNSPPVAGCRRLFLPGRISCSACGRIQVDGAIVLSCIDGYVS